MMITLNHFDAALKDLGRMLGIDSLAWDSDASCLLEFADNVGITLYFNDDRDELYFYALVGEIAPDAPTSLLGELLESNLFGIGTRGASFGLDRDNGLLYLSRSVPEGAVSGEYLYRCLNDMLDVLRRWQPKLSAALAGNAGRAIEGPVAAVGRNQGISDQHGHIALHP
jgi:hypothetical protein